MLRLHRLNLLLLTTWLCLCSAALGSAALGSAALGQAPAVSLRRELPGDLTRVASAGEKRSLALAQGGPGFLAAWSDRRGAPAYPFDVSDETQSDIWVQRLGPDGAPVDAVPTCVAYLADGALTPQVSWSNGGWLVVWRQLAPFTSNIGSEVLGVRVRADGSLVDTAPFSIEVGTIFEHHVASDAHGWVVMSSTDAAGLVARRIDPMAAQPVGASVTVATTAVQGAGLAYAQGTFLCVWSAAGSSASPDVLGRRFGAALTPIDATPRVLGATPQRDVNPVIAANGSEFFLTWQAFDAVLSVGPLLATRVSLDAVALDVPARVLTTGISALQGPVAAGAVWDGTQWFVTFTSADTARFARISSAGVVLDFEGRVVSPSNHPQRATGIARSPLGGVVLARVQPVGVATGAGFHVVCTHIAVFAGVGPDFVVGRSAPSQLAAALASDGNGAALAFVSVSAGASRVLVTRLNGEGLALDAAPLEVAVESFVFDVDIAWDGSRYLIAWTSLGPNANDNHLRVRRLSFAGQFLDPAPVSLGPGWRVAAAAGVGEFALSATGLPAANLPHRFWRLRGQDGAVLQGPTDLGVAAAQAFDLVAYPGGYLHTLTQAVFGPNGNQILTQAIDTNGSIGTPTVLHAGHMAFGVFDSIWEGSSLLCSWATTGTGGNVQRILGRRFDGSLAPVDPAPFEIARVGSGETGIKTLSVGWDGSQFLFVYQSSRAPGAPYESRSDVRGARVPPSGIGRDPLGFVLEGTVGSEVAPTVVGLALGGALCASSLFRPEAPYAGYRIGVRKLDGDCPPPVQYCSGKLNSLGIIPSVGTSGSSSVAANDLEVTLVGGIPNSVGPVMSSTAPDSTALFGGLLCLQTPLIPGPIVGLDGFGAAGVSVPLDASLIGARLHFQWFSRDAAHLDGTGTSLSDARHVTICP